MTKTGGTRVLNQEDLVLKHRVLQPKLAFKKKNQMVPMTKQLFLSAVFLG